MQLEIIRKQRTDNGDVDYVLVETIGTMDIEFVNKTMTDRAGNKVNVDLSIVAVTDLPRASIFRIPGIDKVYRIIMDRKSVIGLHTYFAGEVDGDC